MSSIKKDYIHDVTTQINNPFLKRRLKKELEAHFEDAMALEQSKSEETQQRIKDDMGDPQEIAEIANEGRPSLLVFLQKNFKWGLISVLVILICVLSVGIKTLFDRVNENEAALNSLNKKIAVLEKETLRLDRLEAQIAKVSRGVDFAYVLSEQFLSDRNPGTLVNVTLLNPLNSTSPNEDVTKIEPLGIPYVLTFKGKLPTDLVVRENFGELSFWVRTTSGEVLVAEYKLYSTTTVTRIRSVKNGSVVMNEGDVDLDNGFYLLRTITEWTPSSKMTQDQFTRAEAFVKIRTGLERIPFPIISK